MNEILVHATHVDIMKWEGPAKYHDYEFPKVSIVIPTYNCARAIVLTLENLLEQDYPNYEVVLIDAGSTDRTLEVIKSFNNERFHQYHVSNFNLYEMINRGITCANGTYIHFLFPGNHYLYKHALRHMMSLALDHQNPSLLYCGTWLRDSKSDAKILFRPLTLSLLQQGQQPTSLQAMWFRADLFKEMGKFDTSYQLRSSYEFLCRLLKNPHVETISSTRVLIDFDLQTVTRTMVMGHFLETMRIIYKYFGFWVTVRWFFIQKDTARFTKQWLRSIRYAFIGR